MKYSLDTSALIDGWVRYYPIQNFPKLWQNLGALIERQEIKATEEVLHELEKKEDELQKWAKKQVSFFVRIDLEIQELVQSILKDHPRLVDSRKNRSTADPFVIALAELNSCKVVTGEKSKGKDKIPDVCALRGITCINLLDLIKEQRWVF